MNLHPNEIRDAVRAALSEDVGSGDATSLACIPAEFKSEASINAREEMVVAGLEFADITFQEVCPNLVLTRRLTDGTRIFPNTEILRISGPTRAMLLAERVALNFLQRLSGIATLTRRFVDAINGTSAKILDTRKTTPGWRRFEKYAVTQGGGTNHRIGLDDLILIKDNHLTALADEKPNAVAAAVTRSRRLFPTLRIEVEADCIRQVEQAIDAGADIILMDNMSLEELRASVQLVGGRAKTEASGGVHIGTVRAIAETGVDFISVGAITHSVRAVDIGLDFVS